MAERRAKNDTRARDARSLLIENLGNASGDYLVDLFLRLGRAFAASPNLSNKQKGELAESLARSGLLNYRAEFLASGTNSGEADAARWHIETDSSVQVAAIVGACELADSKSQAERIELLVTLLNAGHMLGSRKFLQGFRDSQTSCLANFEEVERQAYQDRGVIAARLVGLRTLGRDQHYLLEDAELEEFRTLQPGYDQALVFNLIPSLEGSVNPLDIYRGLQNVLYLGYGMAIRDKAVAQPRHDELYGLGEVRG